MKQHRFRKPELVPTIAVLVAVAFMFSLGIWQLHRMQWKNALLASIEQAQSQPPEDLLSHAPAELPQLEWHNVHLTGVLLNNKEFYATPRYLNGQMGFAVLTPLMVATPSGMGYVLINRGWVAPEKKDPATRAGGNPLGPVSVEGVVRTGFKQGRFVPDNAPAKNLWFWYDIPGMAKETGLPLMPVLIDATRIQPIMGSALTVGPTPFPLEITIRNDHLGYAITWFLIGLSALVIYGLYYREEEK